MSPVAIYVHVPFCPSKCGYCDFNSYALTGDIHEATTQAMVREIRESRWRGRPAKTIFFGGGTPTYLAEDQLLRILEAVLDTHPPVEGCEITSEANPGTADAGKFAAMRRAGFNRISLGAQSFVPEDLVRLGRVHQGSEIGRAVRLAREAGFDNLNLDLMFALPGQSVRAWGQNLDLALSLKPDHLSLYCLTIEANTRFYRLNKLGMLNLPEEDDQIAMLNLACEKAAAHGFTRYEISNFARPGRECEHNLCYWRSEEYLGYGPGAVGCYEDQGVRTRYTNARHPENYVQSIATGVGRWAESEVLDAETRLTETLMLGLRLTDGLPEHDVPLSTKERRLWEERGWLRDVPGRVALSEEGRMIHQELVLRLI